MTKDYIYDIEIFNNFFCVVFKDCDTQEFTRYEVSSRTDDRFLLREFLQSDKIRLIGYNNLGFDYPLLHEIITKQSLHSCKPWTFVKNIKIKANTIIESMRADDIRTRFKHQVSPWNIKVPQIDLFKLWHFDRKFVSLKALEFAMRFKNVQDLPYAHNAELTEEQMQVAIDYCDNDVDATHDFFLVSQKHIAIRQAYIDDGYSDTLLSANEIGISKEVFTKLLAEEMKVDQKEIKKLRTRRRKVDIKDVVLDYIKFNDPINQNTLKSFQSHTWYDTSKMTEAEKKKYALKFSVPYKNVTRIYAEGGLHSCCEAGIYESDDDNVLIDLDFASFYPHISFRNNLGPDHIPKEIFNKIYEGFYDDRKKYPKSDPRNYVCKIILNGSYGLSKEQNSFLFDVAWQLGITVNGQLLLTYLTEKLYDAIPESFIIFENTDGVMARIPRKDLHKIQTICDDVEEFCNIPLEAMECDKVIVRDVNNYINVISSKKNKVKAKGVFEVDKDWHKDHSMRIVPIAVANYFINGVTPEQTIRHHHVRKNYPELILDGEECLQSYGIYDYCKRVKIQGKDTLVSNKFHENVADEKVEQKMTRYYISNKGVQLIKKMPPLATKKGELDKYQEEYPNQTMLWDIDELKVIPDRRNQVEAGVYTTVFNKYKTKEFSEYNINTSYYIDECYKIINAIKWEQ